MRSTTFARLAIACKINELCEPKTDGMVAPKVSASQVELCKLRYSAGFNPVQPSVWRFLGITDGLSRPGRTTLPAAASLYGRSLQWFPEPHRERNQF